MLHYFMPNIQLLPSPVFVQGKLNAGKKFLSMLFRCADAVNMHEENRNMQVTVTKSFVKTNSLLQSVKYLLSPQVV